MAAKLTALSKAAATRVLHEMMDCGVNVEFSGKGAVLQVIRARCEGDQLKATERTLLAQGEPDGWRGVAHDGTELFYGSIPSPIFPAGMDPWKCFPLTLRLV